MGICTTCGRMIGARETGRVWRDQLVCPECWDALNWPLPQAKQEDNLHALARAREEVAKNATRAGRVEYATPAAVRPGPSELDQATKVAQFIKVILGIAVSVVILGVVLRCAGIVGIGRPSGGSGGGSSPDPGPSGPVILVDAPVLFQDYAVNEVAADAKYRGRILGVRGVVDSIGRDILDNPYVTLRGGGPSDSWWVHRTFPKEKSGDLVDLRPGDRVTIGGICKGKSLGMVVLSPCTLHR